MIFPTSLSGGDMFSRSLVIFGNTLREFFGGVDISLGQLYCLPHYFLLLLGKKTGFLRLNPQDLMETNVGNIC